MKILYILLFFILLFSCKQEADNGIKIDLTQKKDQDTLLGIRRFRKLSYIIFERFMHRFPNPAIICRQ